MIMNIEAKKPLKATSAEGQWAGREPREGSQEGPSRETLGQREEGGANTLGKENS